ncbi:MAG: hypothetical protein Aurels2KO_38550 [Aureliella sp.]
MGKSVSVQFTPATAEYTMPDVADPNGGATYTVQLQSTPYPVAINSADFGGDPVVVIDLHGYPDSGGTITLAEGGETQSIVLHPVSGKAEILP